MKPLFTGTEWSFEKIERTWDVIDNIAQEKFGLDYYRPQLEMITSEQMLDAYSSVAMPVMYNHWSFGKSFIQNKKDYEKGRMGLAYEVVINTSPSIAYLMENNTMTMQALVMAHAVCGHGSFFKNNYLFKEWTEARSILDYLSFAKEFIAKCEDSKGHRRVELLLDDLHSIKYYGVDRYKRPAKLKVEEMKARKQEWEDYRRESFSEEHLTVPNYKEVDLDRVYRNFRADHRTFPEENLLYFIEKHAPLLRGWEREIVRIVRKTSQYFYPQMQTQLMNEGWASFIHYTLMTELQEQGHITSGAYLEFLESHSAVTCQRAYDQPGYGGINVYALGYYMMKDIKRICQEPDDEDRYWFPDIAGQDWLSTLKWIVENFKDDSFVLQFLSPKTIRHFQLFTLYDEKEAENYLVKHVHGDEDILDIRQALAKHYSVSYNLPQIEVSDVDWDDDRTLHLTHTAYDGVKLNYEHAKTTLSHVRNLWGFGVNLSYVDPEGKEIDFID